MLGESVIDWVSLLEVGRFCERLGECEKLGESVRDWVSLLEVD